MPPFVTVRVPVDARLALGVRLGVVVELEHADKDGERVKLSAPLPLDRAEGVLPAHAPSHAGAFKLYVGRCVPSNELRGDGDCGDRDPVSDASDRDPVGVAPSVITVALPAGDEDGHEEPLRVTLGDAVPLPDRDATETVTLRDGTRLKLARCVPAIE